MPRRYLSILTVAALLSLWMAADPARAARGTVDGAVRFALEDGTMVPAAGTRVYLMRAAVAVPEDEVEHGLIVYSAVDRINTAIRSFTSTSRT